MGPGDQTIWVLADDRPGTANQAIGVGEALGRPFQTKKLIYNSWAKWPNCAMGLAGLFSSAPPTLQNKQDIAPPWPDLIISAGRRSACVALWIKKKSLGKTRIVQIMNPVWRKRAFDLLVIPTHDGLPEMPNLIHTFGSPGRLNAQRLINAGGKWRSQFSSYPSPRLGVLLGGVAKSYGLDSEKAATMLREANDAAASANGSLLISTSRRTPPEIIDTVGRYITVPYYLYDWRLGGDNPYDAILAHSDAILVSGDSLSMLSEACFAGKKVYIYAPPGLAPKKHGLLHRDLARKNYAEFWMGRMETGGIYPKLSAAEEVAREIERRFF